MMKFKPSKLEFLTNKLPIHINVYVYVHQAEDKNSLISLYESTTLLLSAKYNKINSKNKNKFGCLFALTPMP